MDALSRSQVERLGRRLRKEVAPSLEDLRLLEQVRRTYEDARLEVVGTLRRDGLQGASRLKTTSTIIEKLRREPGMSLVRMQDIAGVRLVIEGSRLDQDRLVERIQLLFPDARTTDRRESPSFGYRAVHVIVRTRGCLVEVQVRTSMQDKWAQIMERLADVFGRQIRYGQPPSDPDAEPTPGMTRRQIVELLQSVSTRIDVIEAATAALERQEPLLDVAGRSVDHDGVPWLDRARQAIAEDERKLHSLLDQLHTAFGDK
jgi:Region found in RelA / SpoT proteins